MRDRKRLHRLHQIHEQLLKRREQEQQLAARKVAEEEEILHALKDMQQSAEEVGSGSWSSVGQVLEWKRYLALLENQATMQEETVSLCNKVLDERKEDTRLALQDAKRWEMLSGHVHTAYLLERDRKEQKAADDMAVMRATREPQNR